MEVVAEVFGRYVLGFGMRETEDRCDADGRNRVGGEAADEAASVGRLHQIDFLPGVLQQQAA